MRIVFWILYWVLHAYSLLILVRAILSWIHPRTNRWTVLLQRVTEPVVDPVRRLLTRFIPGAVRTIDFSPAVAILLIQLLERIVVRLS